MNLEQKINKMNLEQKINKMNLEQKINYLENQIYQTTLNNLKPNKITKIKRVLKKANEVLKECAKGASYAIRN